MLVDAVKRLFAQRPTWPFLFLLFSITSHAATQGAPGAVTSGTSEITYVQGLFTRISGFADMPLGTWSGSGPLTANDNICVGRSGVGLFSSGAYRVRASGDGEPGDPSAFTLTNGTDLLYYNVFFNDQTGTTGRTQLTGGLTLHGQSGGGFGFVFNLIFGCIFNNANLSIEVPETQLQQHRGTFSGTLSLTLIPE